MPSTDARPHGAMLFHFNSGATAHIQWCNDISMCVRGPSPSPHIDHFTNCKSPYVMYSVSFGAISETINCNWKHAKRRSNSYNVSFHSGIYADVSGPRVCVCVMCDDAHFCYIQISSIVRMRNYKIYAISCVNRCVPLHAFSIIHSPFLSSLVARLTANACVCAVRSFGGVQRSRAARREYRRMPPLYVHSKRQYSQGYARYVCFVHQMHIT